MRTVFKRVGVILLAVTMILGVTVPCLAAQRGKITVLLADADPQMTNGTRVHICRIADILPDGYAPTAAFEDSGISIAGVTNSPNEATAKTLADYIKEHNAPTQSTVVENGILSFTDLDLGIWLVYGDEGNRYTFNPYLVFLPYTADNTLQYEIISTPKIDDSQSDNVSIYVMKKWDDKNNAAKKRPDSVTVELLNGGTAIASVSLSETNGWAHTFTDLPKDGTYSVRENHVSDYTAQYSGDAINGFVVTNTYAGEKLPQTGQYWWPIVLLAVTGVCFILLGIVDLRVKKYGKKK